MFKNVKAEIYEHAEHIPAVRYNEGGVVVVSDLHIPYHLNEAIEWVFGKYADKDSVLVINGDLIDALSIGKFPSQKFEALYDSVVEANKFIVSAAKLFKYVIVLDGNHERRLMRYVAENAKQLAPFVANSPNYYITKKIRLTRDSDGYIKIDVIGEFKNVLYFDSRFMLLNNVLLSHPQNYLSTPGATVRKVIQSALSERISFDVCVIGHTHKIAYIYEAGRVGIESGCLTYVNDYVTKPGYMKHANQYGFVYMYMENGKVSSISPVDLTFKLTTTGL